METKTASHTSGKNKKTTTGVSASTDQRFSKVKFAWDFREYQQRVINNSAKYLQENKKIHIVAAPGSGKTILGLELIRKLGQPALILSPTIAIREQWKERFEEAFIPKTEKIDNYFSCSLLKPNLLTSITYQGLYTSYRKISPSNEDPYAKKPLKNPEEGDDSIEDAPQENYSGVDIIKLMNEKNIRVLCLDEAHHLRAEWQKALYEFVSKVEHDVTIIALTATPPYDSKKIEWDKYIAMCGPIDEEIFVPELIRAKNLCPHQDYIYYNFPTKAEEEIIQKYKDTATQAMKDIFEKREFLEIIKNAPFYKEPEEYADELSENPDFVKSMLAFLNESNEKPNKRLLKVLERDDRKIDWDLQIAEFLFQGIIKDDHLFSVKDREFVKNFLSKYGLVEKNQVCLTTNGELEKLLFSSIGKLNSIDKIVEEEWKDIGEKLRLLILTDYIRVNSNVLGSDQEVKEMGVIPIFELIRRKNLGLKLAVVSGKIIIAPNDCLAEITEIAKNEKTRLKTIAIKGTEHSELKFEGGNNAQKIAVITKAFNAGVVHGIVGTKSLLGEGWDSPVINSLILASCVGSFMLSNQMRGRAIRIDKNVPDKVSNIWHLTAILPQHLIPEVKNNMPPSADYAMLERRFKGFLGLSYTQDIIESGLQRANTLTAPYEKTNINAANEKSFKYAREREETSRRWQAALSKSGNEVLIQNEIPKPKRGFFPTLFIRPSHYSTIKKITHATMKTFKELRLIDRRAKPMIEKDHKNQQVNVGIRRCSNYEKNIFHQAISEALGGFEEPKYVLIKTNPDNGKIDYRAAFAVPEIFSNKKENAEVFKEKMHKRLMDLDLYFTRSETGKKHLAMVKKKAYVNKNSQEISARMKMRQK